MVLWVYRMAMQELTQLSPDAVLVFEPPPEPELPQNPGMDYYFHLRERLAYVHEHAQQVLEDAYVAHSHGREFEAGENV